MSRRQQLLRPYGAGERPIIIPPRLEGSWPGGPVSGCGYLLDNSRIGDPREFQPGRSTTPAGTSNVRVEYPLQANGWPALSASCWVYKSGSSVTDYCFGQYFPSGTQRSWTINLEVTDRPTFRISADGTSGNVKQYELDPIGAGRWVHLAFTYANNQLLVYQNGVRGNPNIVVDAPVGNLPTQPTIPISALSRSSDGGNPINGYMYDCRIWSRVLTRDEVYKVFLGESVLEGLELQDYLDDKDPDRSFDSSRYGRHGTKLNFVVADHTTELLAPRSAQNDHGYSEGQRFYNGGDFFFANDVNLPNAKGAVEIWYRHRVHNQIRYQCGITGSDDARVRIGSNGSGQMLFGIGSDTSISTAIKGIDGEVWRRRIEWDNNNYKTFMDGVETGSGTYTGNVNLDGTAKRFGLGGVWITGSSTQNQYPSDQTIYRVRITGATDDDVIYDTARDGWGYIVGTGATDPFTVYVPRDEATSVPHETATQFGRDSNIETNTDFRGATGDVRVSFTFNVTETNSTPKICSQRTNPSGSPFDVYMNTSGQLVTRINDTGFNQTTTNSYNDGKNYEFVWERVAGNATGGIRDMDGNWIEQFTPQAFPDQLQNAGQDKCWMLNGEVGGSSWVEGFCWDVRMQIGNKLDIYSGYEATQQFWPDCQLINVQTAVVPGSGSPVSTQVLDALGNPIQYNGENPRSGQLEQSNCWGTDGVGSLNAWFTRTLPEYTFPFTVGCRAKSFAASTGSDYLLGCGNDAATDCFYGFGVEDATLSMVFRRENNLGANTVKVTEAYIDLQEKWWDLAVVWVNENYVKFYVDGLLKWEGSLTGDRPPHLPLNGVSLNAMRPFNINAPHNHCHYADWFFVGRELSSSEIATWAQCGDTQDMNFTMRCPMSEGMNGLAGLPLGDIVHDVTGNSNHAWGLLQIYESNWHKQDHFHWNYKQGHTASELVDNPELLGADTWSKGTRPSGVAQQYEFPSNTPINTMDSATVDGKCTINFTCNPLDPTYAGLQYPGTLPPNGHRVRVQFRFRVDSIDDNEADLQIRFNVGGWKTPTVRYPVTEVGIGKWVTCEWEGISDGGNFICAAYQSGSGLGFTASMTFDRISITSVNVPALEDGSADADGSPIANPAGAYNNNAESQINFTGHPDAPWHKQVYKGYTSRRNSSISRVELGAMNVPIEYRQADVEYMIYTKWRMFNYDTAMRPTDSQTGGLQSLVSRITESLMSVFNQAQAWVDIDYSSMGINIADGQWHELVYTVDGPNDKFIAWIDGMKAGEVTNTGFGLLFDTFTRVSFVGSTAGNWLNGDFARGRIVLGRVAKKASDALTGKAWVDVICNDGQFNDISDDAQSFPGWQGSGVGSETFPLAEVPKDYLFNGVIDEEAWNRSYIDGKQERNYKVSSNRVTQLPRPIVTAAVVPDAPSSSATFMRFEIRWSEPVSGFTNSVDDLIGINAVLGGFTELTPGLVYEITAIHTLPGAGQYGLEIPAGACVSQATGAGNAKSTGSTTYVP